VPELPPPGKRINVSGMSGSGKSTLGRSLAKLQEVPYIELDSFWHLPGWKERPMEEFRELVSRTVVMDGWVIDGNYSRVRDIVWNRADTIIWLDYPLPVILGRVTRRTFRRWQTQELLWGANRESGFWRFFLDPRDSLFWFILSNYRRRRRQANELMGPEQHPGKVVLRFTDPFEADRWLSQLLARSGEQAAP
jgi:adenylate kinase family enzyme